MDKLIVEVIKPKEGLDPFYYARGLPVTDCLYLLKVDLNSFYSNDKPKVFYTLYPKLVFLNISL